MHDGHVLGLTRARREYCPPIGGAGCLDRLDGLGDRSGLVGFDKNGIAGPDKRGLADALSIGHQEIIADDLDTISDRFRETYPSVLIEFRERILDGGDGISV